MARMAILDVVALAAVAAVIVVILAAFAVTAFPLLTSQGISLNNTTSASAVIIPPGGRILIGMSTGLSGIGGSSQAIDDQRGAELAREDRFTIHVGGTEFAVAPLDIQDDQCSAEGGQMVANRFVSNQAIVAVVGPMCSSACQAAAPIFDAAGYTTISQSCTAPNLTRSGFSSFNRNVASDAFQGVVAAHFVYQTLNVRRIATVHDGSPYGEELVSVVAKHFTDLGGEVIAADSINVGESDFRGLLENIAAKQPELIYFGGFPAEAAHLAEQRPDANLDGILFMGGDGIFTPEYIQMAGRAAEDTFTSAVTAPESSALHAFVARYEDEYDEAPHTPYHAHVYDAINMILDAIEAVGTVDGDGNLVIDRGALSRYIRSIKNFRGLTGLLNCDGTGECSTADISIVTVRDGQFVEVAIGRVTNGEVIFMEPPRQSRN